MQMAGRTGKERILWVLVGLCLSLLQLHFASGVATDNTTQWVSQNSNVSTASVEVSSAESTTIFIGIQPNGSSPPPPPGCHGQSLSCGAIAGIVIGAVVGVIIIIVVVIIVVRFMMKRKQSATDSAENGTSGTPRRDNATTNHNKNADKSTKQNGEIESTKMTDRPKSSKPKARDQSTNGSALPPAQFPEVNTRRTILPPLETSTSQPKKAVQSEANTEDSKRHRRRRNSVTDGTQSPVKMSTSASRELPPLSTVSSLVAGNESPEKHRHRRRDDDNDDF